MMSGLDVVKCNRLQIMDLYKVWSNIGDSFILLSLQPITIGRFQADPRQIHLLIAKRILRYLIAAVHYGLWCPRGKHFSFNVYNDVDWEGDVDDKMSTSGGSFFLGDYLVSWLSNNQDSISLSTTKEKYISTTSCCTKLLWMKETFQHVQVFYD